MPDKRRTPESGINDILFDFDARHATQLKTCRQEAHDRKGKARDELCDACQKPHSCDAIKAMLSEYKRRGMSAEKCAKDAPWNWGYICHVREVVKMKDIDSSKAITMGEDLEQEAGEGQCKVKASRSNDQSTDGLKAASNKTKQASDKKSIKESSSKASKGQGTKGRERHR